MTPREMIHINARALISERTDMKPRAFLLAHGFDEKTLTHHCYDMRVSTAMRLCHAIGCTPNELFDGLYEEGNVCDTEEQAIEV